MATSGTALTERVSTSARSVLAGQVIAVTVASLAVALSHRENDGLWYQGDAPRHALNALFWKDLATDGYWPPRQFALDYYARYPAIAPAQYPPLFYWLNGVVALLVGEGPFVSKYLVLAASWAASLYLLAWVRQSIGPDWGWLAPVFSWTPGMVTWSHAVMLNVPAAFATAATLYHVRCALEQPECARRHGVLGGAACLAGLATYHVYLLTLPVIAVWLINHALNRRNSLPHRTERNLLSRHAMLLLLSLVAIAGVGGVAIVSPIDVRWALPKLEQLSSIDNWTFYIRRAYLLLGGVVLLPVVAGAYYVAMWRRREGWWLGSWVGCQLVVLTLLSSRDVRYAVPLLFPLSALAIWGALFFVEQVQRRVAIKHARLVFTLVVVGIIAAQGIVAGRTVVPRVAGMADVVAYLGQHGDDTTVLYDGFYDGVFAYYMRLADPQFGRRVVAAHKSLYAYARVPGWKQQEFVANRDELIEKVRQQGCRWLAIEMGHPSSQWSVAALLREVVVDHPFVFEREFQLEAPDAMAVRLFRIEGPVADKVDQVELPFPVLGDGVVLIGSPVKRRQTEPRP